MNQSPMVSIVIPVFNGANFLAQAIESALAQTYRNIEIIVVNDGSTDGGATRGIAREFGTAIRYVEKENGGVATALNTGITAMRGELFSWLSHDDLYKPNKVARQLDAYNRFGTTCVVIGDFELMDGDGVTYDVISASGPNMIARPLDAVFFGLINGCALLVPRILFDRAGLFEPDLPTTQDYHLWYRIARVAPFVHCPHADVRQRSHPQQGSKLAAHLDEASRMFIHLVDSTPAEIMRAYDGSELRFLSRIHGARGNLYPGLARYLEFRMDWLHAAACRDSAADWEQPGARFPVPVYARGEPEGFFQKLSPARLRGKSAVEIGGFVAGGVRGALDSIGKRILQDPLREALGGRNRVSFSHVSERDAAETLRAAAKHGLPTILFLTHALGGGAHRHLSELTAALNGRANCIVACGKPGSIALLFDCVRCEAGLVFRTPDHLAALAQVLKHAGVNRADVHHVAGFENEVQTLLKLLQIDFDVTLVDYHLLATDPHLCFLDGVFVGDERLADPECGMLRPEPLPLLRGAQRAIAISRDIAARVRSLYPHLPLVAARHWRERSPMRMRHVFAPHLWDNEPLRIVVTGWIVENKARHTICEAARIVKARRLPLRFHVLGKMDLPESEQRELAGTLTVHGWFPSERFSEMLGSIAPHVAWLPAQVPETWSYVLTDFMEAALPVAASAIGAIPERCFGRPSTWLLPPDSPPQAWVDWFLALHAANLDLRPKWAPIDHLPPAEDFYFDAYLAPVRIPDAFQ